MLNNTLFKDIEIRGERKRSKKGSKPVFINCLIIEHTLGCLLWRLYIGEGKHTINQYNYWTLNKEYNQIQLMLLPPSLEELIPESHMVRVVNKTIERFNIEQLLETYKKREIEKLLEMK